MQWLGKSKRKTLDSHSQFANLYVDQWPMTNQSDKYRTGALKWHFVLYIDHKSCVRLACQCYHPQRTVVYVIHSRLSMPPNFTLNCHQMKRLHCTFQKWWSFHIKCDWKAPKESSRTGGRRWGGHLQEGGDQGAGGDGGTCGRAVGQGAVQLLMATGYLLTIIIWKPWIGTPCVM